MYELRGRNTTCKAVDSRHDNASCPLLDEATSFFQRMRMRIQDDGVKDLSARWESPSKIFSDLFKTHHAFTKLLVLRFRLKTLLY